MGLEWSDNRTHRSEAMAKDPPTTQEVRANILNSLSDHERRMTATVRSWVTLLRHSRIDLPVEQWLLHQPVPTTTDPELLTCHEKGEE